MRSPFSKPRRWAGAALAAALLAALPTAHAQSRLTPPLPDLTGVLNPSNTDGKTARQWAIILGKALFWDQQAGSDGVACASCHYSAGADSRITNQLSPGALDVTAGAGGDRAFGSNRADNGGVVPGSMPSGSTAAPNYTLRDLDFPLHRLSDVKNRNSSLTTATNDVVSSQGAFAAPFVSISATTGKETCGTPRADLFHAGGFPARQVAVRNSATTINAVFNRRLLWDGSAANLFNGVGSHGVRDIVGNPDKRLVVLNALGQAELGIVQLPDAALASQAVGPIVNDIEMSCAGRTLADVGRKMLATGIRPLAKQKIDAADSVFAGMIDGTGRGLAAAHGYAALVKRAFDPKYWNAPGRYTISNGTLTTVTGTRGYTQMEHNWSLFWGLSIMLYESTLISGSSEFDALLANRTLTVRDTRTGPPFGCTANGAVDPLLLRGCQIFFQERSPATNPPGGGCQSCHGGAALFSNAARQRGQDNPHLAQLGTPIDAQQDPPGIADLGFQNTGVRPAFTDLKAGGRDPYGRPLSYSVQYSDYLKGLAAGLTDAQSLEQHVIDPELKAAIQAGTAFLNPSSTTALSKVHVAGASKVPTMRNVALTPPYTSAGMFSDLRQMVKFYNRQGNRRDILAAGSADAMGTACTAGDDSGTGADGRRSYDELKQTAQTCHTNVLVGIGTINMLDCDLPGSSCDPATDDIAAVVRFLQALTDPKVQCDAAPFDHPSLMLTLGHRARDSNADGKADDILFEMPAAGAAGYDPASGFCIPNSGNLFAPGMQGRAGGTRVPLPAAVTSATSARR